MTRVHRSVPHPEWVLMYRRGLTAAAIARLVGAPGSTVSYHIGVASSSEPGLRSEHQAKRAAAAGAHLERLRQGLQLLDEIKAFVAVRDRFPSLKSPESRERTLARWLLRRRQDAAAGVLSPVYAEALANLPGWDQSARARAEEARWRLRLSQLTAYVEAGNEWPRHKDTDSEQERVLGVWLHIQRYKRRRRELDPVKAELLDRTAPGWREGRRPSR